MHHEKAMCNAFMRHEGRKNDESSSGNATHSGWPALPGYFLSQSTRRQVFVKRELGDLKQDDDDSYENGV